MKTVVIYASTHGTTEKVAQLIAHELPFSDTRLIRLKKGETIYPDDYDLLIIGGSIHAGRIQKRIQTFINNNMLSLLEKNTALFLCCMDEKETENQFVKAFPQLLRNHAISSCCPGGEFNLEKMSFLQKLIVKKVAGISSSISKIDMDEIHRFTQEIVQKNKIKKTY